jgi:hypothetical protein
MLSDLACILSVARMLDFVAQFHIDRPPSASAIGKRFPLEQGGQRRLKQEISVSGWMRLGRAVIEMEQMHRTVTISQDISERTVASGLGKAIALGFAGVLWLAGHSCNKGEANAREATKRIGLALELEPRALTVEEEKAKAAMPGSEFEECARLFPVMIVIPAGSFVMGSPEHEWGARQRVAIDADDRYNDADHD